MERRDFLALSLGAASLGATALPGVAAAQTGDTPRPSWPPRENFLLWNGLPPAAPAILPRSAPTITGGPGDYHDIWMRGTASPDVGVFRPANPDGRAVLVIPGGGYSFVSLRGEGMDVAHALTGQGITCFVLNYRLPGEGWTDRANVPLMDAQRAMRLIRFRARHYRIDPAKLGVIGFSAGGHLAAALATLQDIRLYRAVDAADRLLARPEFAGLMYAVSNIEAGRSFGGSRTNLLGPEPDPAMERRYAADKRMGPDTPPLFIVHAQDDTTVPVQNGIDLFLAARRERVPVEAHFPERGGHGFGARLPKENPDSLWPVLFGRWMAQTLARVR